MNYEEKYKQALERAKRLHGEPACRTEKIVCEQIFPELAESRNEQIRKTLTELVSDTHGDSLWLAYNAHKDDLLTWLEQQKPIDKDKLAKGFFRQCATSFINYLDANVQKGKMCLSNMECEDIENAFMNADWAKLHRYHNKYIKEGDLDSEGDKQKSKFKVGDKVLWKYDKSRVYKIKKVSEYCTYWVESIGCGSGWWSEDELEPYTLDPDKVIEWLVANIIDFEDYVRLFKKDFGL